MYETVCKDLDKELYELVSQDSMSLQIDFDTLLQNSLTKLENQSSKDLVTNNSMKLALIYKTSLEKCNEK